LAYTLWFTGLPCSGKTTLVNEIKNIYFKNLPVEIIDGDSLRTTLCEDLGFSINDREENIRRIRHLCNILNNQKIYCLVAVITPYENMREKNRKIIKNYYEIFVDTPLNECINRDVKGMYKKALNGEIKNFTGIDDKFDRPKHSDLIIYTEYEDLNRSIFKLIDFLNNK